MRRRQGDDRLPVALERRRLYILPTRAGVAFGVLLLLMLVAGLNYANSLALFLTFLLAAFALVAMQQCHRNLLGVQVQSLCRRAAVRRQPRGAARLARQPGRHGAPRPRGGASTARRAWRRMRPRGARACLDVPLPAARRGLLRIERVRLSTAHPFGLFRVWTWVHAPLEMLVYPRPLGRLPMPVYGELQSGRQRAPRPPAPTSGPGCARSATATRRAQVDWKAYAREAPLLVKEYRPGAARSCACSTSPPCGSPTPRRG